MGSLGKHENVVILNINNLVKLLLSLGNYLIFRLNDMRYSISPIGIPTGDCRYAKCHRSPLRDGQKIENLISNIVYQINP